MLVIAGYVVVVLGIFGGYLMAGGHLGGLWQPAEVVMIMGGAIGAFLIQNPMKTIKAVGRDVKKGIFAKTSGKDQNTALMSLLFELVSKIKRDGEMAIEGDVENPESSELFNRYPEVMKDEVLSEFLLDYLRVMIASKLQPHEIEALMDAELSNRKAEKLKPADALQTCADGLPAFGIIAAVMGVVHVMDSVGQVSNGELGRMIGAALVGTFLGILLGYGFVGPLAKLLEGQAKEQNVRCECIKTVLLGLLAGYPAQVATEFGRKVLYTASRPTYLELKESLRGIKKAA